MEAQTMTYLTPGRSSKQDQKNKSATIFTSHSLVNLFARSRSADCGTQFWSCGAQVHMVKAKSLIAAPQHKLWVICSERDRAG
jgi:hypothetical protein